jgi:flagellar basal-body rod protein FlgG
MNSALWVAKTGLDAQQTQMTVISNNLANVNTTGFKRGRATFQDLLYQNYGQVGSQTSTQTQSPSGLMIGTGVHIGATENLFQQGNLQQTNNNLDVAINGRGFFQVQMPDGSLAYTRDGSFQVNSQGQLVTASGYLVQPGITIPQAAQSVTISADGIVDVQLANQTAPQQVGTLTIADFINPSGLQTQGGNLYTETAASGSPQTGTPSLNGLGSLVQGSVESSNVNVVEEMVNMIQTQRAYEMNSKAISTVDQMLQNLTQNMT